MSPILGRQAQTIQPQAAQNQFPRFSKHFQKIIFFEYQTRQCRNEADLLISDNPLSPVIFTISEGCSLYFLGTLHNYRKTPLSPVNIWLFASRPTIMCAMKKYIPLLLACAALAGCTINTAPSFGAATTTESGNGKATYRLAGSHWTDVSKIRDEATRLNDQVGQKKITKVQAAQHLNRFRLKLVGSNPVDDSVYEVYLRSAVDSQRGAITSAQSKQYVQNALKGWQQRWPNMRSKPTNPAFTNFLMELMNMQPLQ